MMHNITHQSINLNSNYYNTVITKNYSLSEKKFFKSKQKHSIVASMTSQIPAKLPSNYKVAMSESNAKANVRIPCSVECLWSTRKSLITDYDSSNLKWKVLYSMEGPQYYPRLKMKREYVGLSTTSFESDIPVPYIGNIFDMQTVKDSVFQTSVNKASFIATNCNSKNNREGLVKKLMKLYPIDSLASCLNNVKEKITKKGNWGENKINILRTYKFHLAFENQCEIDYVTEKVWLSLMSGTLPIYYGAPNIKNLVPTNSMIYYADFDSIEQLASYLKFLEKNETAYNYYHEWRKFPLEDFVLEKYKHTNEHIQCRICKWVASQDLNLTWLHKFQDIRMTASPGDSIPLILHQTSKSWGESNTYSFREECEHMYRLDRWQYMYWSDDDIEHFVKWMFPQYFNKWKKITPYIRKLDTVRYMWMHRYGGMYLDADVECVRPSSHFIKGLPQGKIAWLGGFPEPFFLLSSPGHDFWLFVIENILETWRKLHTRQSSGPQGLNRLAMDWVKLHGVDSVKLFEMKNASEAKAIDDRKITSSWRWYIPASHFDEKIIHLKSNFQLGFFPNEVIDPTACFGKSKQFNCSKLNHCAQNIQNALFVHHCQQSHGI